MKCPKCDILLAISERQGIEIDYCPQCRGIWLDRGELDKIIERSAAELSSSSSRRHDDDDYKKHKKQDSDDFRRHDAGSFDSQSKYSSGGSHGHHPHKKKSFLEDIFDFD